VLRAAATRPNLRDMSSRATRRPNRFAKPPHWSDAAAPTPAPTPDTEELGPTRYGDWVRKGIAVDF
jgi:hypothetical protein